MLHPYLYLAVILFELVFSFSMVVYVGSLLYSGFMGSPYVPTKRKVIARILAPARLTHDKFLLELGCGDGRVLREAARRYGLQGRGIDVNPVVILLAKIKTRLSGLDGITFGVENLKKTNLGTADVLYLFLMPDLLTKMVPRFKKEMKKGALIISHGFVITGLEKNLIKKLEDKPFSTYYYRI